jgi:ABC-type multidrug transport system fused ATPase/permease subunit
MGDQRMKGHLTWLKGYAVQIKGLLLLSTLTMIVESLASIGVVGLQQQMIDNVFIHEQYGLFLPLVLKIAGLAILYTLFHGLIPIITVRTLSFFQYSMSRDLMAYMHRIPIRDLQKERTARFVQLFSNDVNMASQMLGLDGPRTLQQVISIGVLVTIIVMESPVLLLAILVFTLAYILLGRYFGSKVKTVSKQVQQERANLLVGLEEGISSTREVIAYHRTPWEMNKIYALFGTYFNRVMEEGRLENKQMFLSDPLRWCAIFLVLGYGGFLVFQDAMSIGMFVIIYQFTYQLMDGIQQLFKLVMGFSNRIASVERIRDVMGSKAESEGTVRLSDPIRELAFQNVTFTYIPNTPDILQGMDFDIPIGSKVAFVGESGGGKSTIAQLLIRFFEVNSGAILVNGRPLEQYRSQDWMERVGTVFQEPYLFPDTLRVNLTLGNEVSEEQMLEICKRVKIHEYIQSLPDGYDTVIGERGITLSGGQRQRLAIARALLRNPELLILDEATSSLDLETERSVQSELDRLRKGKTTLIIAHRLSTIQNADRIFVIENGRVVEQGTHEELLQHGEVYCRLVEAQLSSVPA